MRAALKLNYMNHCRDTMSAVECDCQQCKFSGRIAIGSLDYYKFTCRRLAYCKYGCWLNIGDDTFRLYMSQLGSKYDIPYEYLDMFLFWYSQIRDGNYTIVTKLDGQHESSTTIVLMYDKIQLGDQFIKPYSSFDLGGLGEDRYVYSLGDRCYKAHFVALSLAVNGADLLY